MACNGAGKSAWKRETCDRLPEHYFVEDVYISTDPRRSTRSGATTGSRRTPATMWTRRGCPSGTDQLGAGPVVDLHTFLPGEVTHPLTTKVDCGVEDSERRRDS